MTNVQIPILPEKPRRAPRWALLHLPILGLLALFTICTLNAFTSFQYRDFFVVEHLDTLHIPLTPNTKKLLLNTFGHLPISSDIPLTVEAVLRDADKTLSITMQESNITGIAYRDTQGNSHFLGKHPWSEKQQPIRLFSKPFATLSTGERARVDITSSYLSLNTNSDNAGFQNRPNVPTTFQPTIAHSGVYNGTPYQLYLQTGLNVSDIAFHLTTGITDSQTIEQMMSASLSTVGLSTLVLTNGYTFPTREISNNTFIDSENNETIMRMNATTSDGETVWRYAVIGADRSIVSTFPLELAEYSILQQPNTCVKNAHSWFYSQQPNANTLSDTLTANVAQNAKAIRFCFPE